VWCSVVERTLAWGRGEERPSWEQARRARAPWWECNGVDKAGADL
jgi:hypothetical protein